MVSSFIPCALHVGIKYALNCALFANINTLFYNRVGKMQHCRAFYQKNRSVMILFYSIQVPEKKIRSRLQMVI